MTTVHGRSWLRLCLAALGAAGMFLGPGGWLGIDIGPIGSAVLYVALWLLLSSLGAPLAERRAWVAGMFVSLRVAAVRAQPRNAHRRLDRRRFRAAFRDRDAVELDERDLRIQRAASHAGSGLMALLILVLISALATPPELMAPWLRTLIVATVLIGSLIANTLTENVHTVVRYRHEHA